MSPVQKNEELTVNIIDLSYEGMGVAKIDHYPIFIDNALPGEEVTIHIVKANKKYAFAKTLHIEKESPFRVPLTDPNLSRTGIEPLQHMAYSAQLQFKKAQVQQCLHKLHLDAIHVADTCPSPEKTKYRNKAQIPVREIDGHLRAGFYRKNSHDFIPLASFGIQKEEIDAALPGICRILDEFGVSAYDEKNHCGVLRHLILRQGEYSKEMMLTLVTRKDKLFQGEKIAKRLLEEVPNLVSVMQNVNSEKTNVIMGPVTRCLAGKDYIEDEMLGHRFEISATSFYQVNTRQAEAMYQKAIDLAELTGKEIAIDAYCGIGTITLSVAPHVKEIYGVEVVEAAIADAKKNAQLNQIHNAYFEAGKAETVMKRWQREGIQVDAVFVDPPRKGLATEFMDALGEMEPQKIAYISCNPASLARDLQYLAQFGYTTNKVYPYDMFPQTTHVECVCLLEKQ